jgi:integrase
VTRSATRQTVVVEHKKADGSILRTNLERRKEGTWAIDLRAEGLGSKGRPTLKAPGQRYGTKDQAEAVKLAQAMLAGIAGGSTAGTASALLSVPRQMEKYIHLKRAGGRMTHHTAAAAYTCLIRCWAILNQTAGITSWRQFTRPMVGPMVKQLETRTFKGRQLGTNSVLKHLNYLKGFLRWATDEGIVTQSALHRHTAVPPRDTSFTREWLEPHEMGLLLEASFAGRAEYPHNACHAWPEILATLAYTGARESEVLGLRVADLKLGKHGTRNAGTLDITEYAGRRLKNVASRRLFSLWPAHAAILKAYLLRYTPPADGLLFPGPDGKRWGELRGSMDRDLAAAGLTKPGDKPGDPPVLRHITDHSLRHTYISARSRQYRELTYRGRTTLAAVHMADIAGEVGHGSERMTREVYTHASQTPTEGVTELDYATALRLFRKGLVKPPAGRTASKAAARSKATRSVGRKTGPTKAKSAPRKNQRPPGRP